MMSRYILITITSATILLSVIFSSCSNSSTTDNRVVSVANPPSQLAQLMRDMDDKLGDIRLEADKNDVWPSTEFRFPDILEQEPTESSMITEIVSSHSIAFKSIIAEYNMGPSEKGYDAIVNGCLSCHYNSCPGPIVKIKKHLNLTLK